MPLNVQRCVEARYRPGARGTLFMLEVSSLIGLFMSIDAARTLKANLHGNMNACALWLVVDIASN